MKRMNATNRSSGELGDDRWGGADRARSDVSSLPVDGVGGWVAKERS